MHQPKIKLTHFRKSFNIPSDFIRSTCKVLNLEILKFEDEPVIPLHNQILQKENGTLLGMSKSTIGSKPDGWVRMGFRYTKIKEGSMTLWRVSQY